jgi:hypothetical protein
MHGHAGEHRLTRRHTENEDEEFWLPESKNAASPQGRLTSALPSRLEAKSAFLGLFYCSFLYIFTSHKISWLKLAFSYQTLSILKIMPHSCPS